MNKKITFPRRITESLPQRIYFINLMSFFLVVLFIFSFIFAGFAAYRLMGIKQERRETLDNFFYWKQVSENYPNSPDAFFKAGFYSAKLDDKQTARKYLDEAVRLDPSFEKAKKLEQILVTKY